MADDIKGFAAWSSTSPAITAQGRLILKYLQENKDGAKLQDIVQHVEHHAASPESGELSKNAELIVGNAAILGFLERKGSKFLCLAAKEACGPRRRRRRRSRSRRRCRCARRARRRRRCSRRPRRRRVPRCRCGAL